MYVVDHLANFGRDVGIGAWLWRSWQSSAFAFGCCARGACPPSFPRTAGRLAIDHRYGSHRDCKNKAIDAAYHSMFVTNFKWKNSICMSGKTDEVKGRIKEAAGALTGNEKLRVEGQADQADPCHDFATLPV